MNARRLQKKMEVDADRLLQVLNNLSSKIGFIFFCQKLVSHLMEASSVAASDQQMKELFQEVTRLQVLGNLITTLREKEGNQIKLKSESVKVSHLIDVNK